MSRLQALRGKVFAIRRMFGMLAVRRKEIAALVGLAVLYALLEGAGLGLLMPILQYVEAGGAVDAGSGGAIWDALLDLSQGLGLPVTLLSLLAMAFLPILLRQAVYFINTWYMAAVSSRALLRLRARGFAALVHADFGFLDRLSQHGNMVSFLTGQLAVAGTTIIQFIKLIAVLLLTALYIVLLLVISAPLTAIAVVAMAVISLIVRGSVRLSRKYGAESTKALNRAYRAITERSGAIRLIKLLGKEDDETDHVSGLLDDLQQAQVRITIAGARLEIVVDPALMLSVFLIILFGVESLQMNLAGLGLFLFVLLRLNAKAKEFNVGRQKLAAGMESLLYVFRVIEDAETSRTIRSGAKHFEGLREGIELEHVSFHYDDDETVSVLEDVSLSIRAGSLTAMVGRSGAGKSTLVDLLPRLREVQDGQILIDSVPIEQYDLVQLRRSIGFMAQDAVLFNETVLYNLTYGLDREVTESEIEEALRDSYCDEFIREFPDGLQTLVGERGVRLSGGQRQRLALARVLLQDPDILILDEPTSALDSESEKYIQKALDAMHGEKTLIVIAHRLSTVQRADKIVVLEAGRVVETGTHHELYENDGPYRQLFELQMQGALFDG